MRFLVEIILAAAILVSSCFSAGEENIQEPSVSAFSYQERDEAPATDRKDDAIDLNYVNYDPESFYEGIDELCRLGLGEDAEAVIAKYDELYEEMLRIDALMAVAYIRYSADVTDDNRSEENLYMEEVWSETGDALCAACAEILEGPCADVFAEHIGEDSALYLAEYEAMDEEEVRLDRRESELEQAYYEIMNTAEDDAVYVHEGKTWTMSDINGFPGEALANKDYDAYLKIYDGLQKWVNDQVADIYTELLSIRTRVAELNGYDSYTDYAYECLYDRDYTPEDAQSFCDAVKPLAKEYNNGLYYDDMWYEYDAVQPVMDEEELLDTLGEYAGVISPVVYSAWKELTEKGLYDLNTGENAMPGAYSVNLTKWETGFIYEGLCGDCYDFSTLTHEFGHFVDMLVNPVPNVLTSGGSYDLFEISSNGLELLYAAYYDDIYTRSSDIAAFVAVGGQMEGLIDGCIMDEFQRRIYDNPQMTIDEINRLYASVCAEYGRYADGDEEYSWVYTSHNFDSPLYYISYAASALPALEIWVMGQEDRQTAIDTWLAVLNEGAYDRGYCEVLPDCGLHLFTENGAVETVCRPVLAYLEELSAAD